MEWLNTINWTQILTVVVSSLITAGVAFCTLRLGHRLTLDREERTHQRQLERERIAAEEQRSREHHLISTELIFILETFAVNCANVATDRGMPEENAEPRRQEVIVHRYEIPEISFSNVTGNWKVLEPRDMFRVMEIPVMLLDACTHILNESEHLSYGADSMAILRIRSENMTEVGLRAAAVARRLRRLCRFPESPLSDGAYSTTQVLLKVRKRQVKHAMKSESSEDSL
ncbi:hypothetical protein [Pectobacterium brasiliense]|uniref:hypothetical protein n=1 Tax=Pectobacterium brasiliense TaxID=180957 RepID=UPI001968FE00|nr:hypothetical protein [Pectobacterium brasiliense]MBN3262927.1 hypothetical protein [Pectobacterium brasiliense]